MLLKNINNDVLDIYKPHAMQAEHEEADTLIVFYATKITTSHLLVRSSDTDVLIIFLGLTNKISNVTVISNYNGLRKREQLKIYQCDRYC